MAEARPTSEDHRMAEAPQGPRVPPTAGPEPVGDSAQRRRGLGIATAAPVAPKMEAEQEDTNIRLGYPKSLPAPPSAQPKATAKAKAKGMPPYPPYPTVPPPLPPAC